MYRYQDERETVRELQRFLLEIQYDRNITPTFTLDGYYSEGLRAAVFAFQEENDLTPTGIVDEMTWNLIYAEYQAIIEQNRAYELLPPGAFPIAFGAKGHTVRTLQSVLIELAEFYPIVKLPISGQFGIATLDAVRGLQKAYGLYESGEVDSALWGRIIRDYEAKMSIQH